MVQFTRKLASNKVSEWEEYYIDYKELKKLIKKIAKRSWYEKQAVVERSFQAVRSKIGDVDDTKSVSSDVRQEIEIDKSFEDASSFSRRHSFSYANESTPFLHTEGILVSQASFGTIEPSLVSDQDFSEKIKEQCLKIEGFYQKKLQECRFQLENLDHLGSKPSFKKRKPSSNRDLEEYDDDDSLPKDSLRVESMKWSYGEVFRSMNLLHSFSILNYTGLVKIIKKHDKITGIKAKKQLMEIVNEFKSGFVSAKDLLSLISKVEAQMAETFYNGNKLLARNDLLIKQLPNSSWNLVLSGMHLGIIVVLLIWVWWNFITKSWAVAKIQKHGSDTDKLRIALMEMPIEILRVYRGIGVLISCFWCWTYIVYLWKHYRVNYIYLFEFDPRNVYQVDELIIKCSRLTIIYLVNILLYFKITRGEVFSVGPEAANYMPLFMLITLILAMLFPISKASTMMESLKQVIFAPFYHLTFFNSFVGDVLTSIVKPLVDLSYSFCFYSSGEWKKYFVQTQLDDPSPSFSCDRNLAFNIYLAPLIISLPLFFRFLQSIRRYYDTSKRHPNLTNALKYALAYCFVLLGAVHPSFSQAESNYNVFKYLWITCFVISTCYTYSWDVFIDWGLGDVKDGFLRRRRMFSDDWIYYLAIVLDFFLRFTWCLTLIPQLSALFGMHSQRNAQVYIFILSLLEVFRRSYWTLIRVEYEHLHNSQGYRRVDFIPLHFETAQTKEKMSNPETPRKEVILELSVFVLIVLLASGFSLFGPSEQRENP